MKAVYVEHTGPPEVLTYGEVPEPQPRPNDVLIRVRATSLNRLDIFMREGSHGTTITPPQILGRDIAGEVVQVGSEVQGLRPGDRVVAAGSGVGSYAVQIAKAVGARVIATAGTDDKLRKARAIGADDVINHYTEDLAARVRALTAGQGVDVIVEHVGAAVWQACFRSLKEYGRLVTCGVTAGHRVELHLGQVFVRALSIMGVGRGSPDDMRALLRLVALGRVRPVIHQRFALHEAAEAHRLLERSDFFGKVVL